MSINSSEREFFEVLFKRLSDKPSKPLSETTLAESRSNVASILWLLDKSKQPEYMEDQVIARDGHPIPIRIFNYHLARDTPVLIYLMGNGFIYDQFEISALICARIAEYAQVKVVLVNSRLAPENPLPISIYDSFDATHNLLEKRAEKYNLAPKKILLTGYCTGASCALALVKLAHENASFKVDHLILLNGFYDLSTKYESHAEHESQDISFSREFFDYIIRQQNITEGQKLDPFFSPYLNVNFDHLPKTTLLVGECERNRSSSEAFYEKLYNKGVNVEKIVLPGQTHNTIIFFESIKGGKDPAQVIADLTKQ